MEGVNRLVVCFMIEFSRERSLFFFLVYSRESSFIGIKYDVVELINKSFELVDFFYGVNIKDENVYEEKLWYGKLVYYCKGKSLFFLVFSRESSVFVLNDIFGLYNLFFRKKYVENVLNWNYGWVDMFNGFKFVFKFKSRFLFLFKIYWDNEYKWWLERMRVEYGFLVVLKDIESGCFSEIKYYVDNFVNGSFGWVGFLNEVCKKKVYEDNFFNKMLGCVGLFIGIEGMFGFREGLVRIFFIW